MQRDGNSDDRTKTGASGRTPPVIEGEAVEVSARPEATTPAAPEGAETIVEAEAPIVEEVHAEAEAVETNGAGADAIAAPAARKSRSGALALFGILIVAAAGAVAWIAAPGSTPGDGSVKSRVIALLPSAAQKALHVAPAPTAETKPSETPAASDSKPAASAEKPQTEGAGSTEMAKTETPKTETAKPGVTAPVEPKSEASKAEPAPTAAAEPKAADPDASKTAQQSGQTSAAAAPAPGAAPVAAVDARALEDVSVKIDAVQAKTSALQTKLDAALGRIDDLQSKLELAQGKIELAQSKSDAAAASDALAQATQRIEALTQKLAAIEQKLEQPKTDTRAPQARENSAAQSGREFAASRAVVAQATTEALRAGAPLGDDLAALKGLGVVDDKIADLTAYAKTGAPTVAQLTQQWRGLRDKVVALDAPPPGASFSDKLLASAKGVFRVTWSGQGAQNSIGATANRVDAALQKNDLAAAVAACEDFPAVAKNLVADWQKAAAARLKADAAARALLSESISAIGRSSQ